MKSIFKTILPVLIGLLLVITASLIMVGVSAASNKTPVLSDGKETYLEFGSLKVTKQDLYNALKKDYGVNELTRLIDTYLYKEELKNVDEAKLHEYIEKDIFGEAKDSEKQELWEDILKSLVLTGILSVEDCEADKAYTSTNSKAWKAVTSYYKLQYVRENAGKEAVVAKLKSDREAAGKTGLFEEKQMVEYFEKNYGTASFGFFIPYTSMETATAALKSKGVNVEASIATATSNQLAGWVKSSYDSKVKEYPTAEDYFTEEEVIAILIDLYNEALGYINNYNPIITSSLYEVVESNVNTLYAAKVALDEVMEMYSEIRYDLELPLTIEVTGSTETVQVKWNAIDEEKFQLNAETGLLNVTPSATTATNKITATLTLGDATKEVTYSIKVTPLQDDEEEPSETVVTVPAVAKRNTIKFNDSFNNEVNKNATFEWKANDSSSFGGYLSSTSTKLVYDAKDAENFAKSYTVKPVQIGEYYCLAIKVKAGDEVKVEEIANGEEVEKRVPDAFRKEVEEKLIEAAYSKTEGKLEYVEKAYYEKRANANLKIYDRFLEAIYEYDYNTFFSSTLSEKDYPTYKKAKHNQKRVVASVDGLEITADELFKGLEEKYGATCVKSLIDEYLIINSEFNKSYNPYTGLKDSKYVKSLITSNIKSFKQNFEQDYFTYSYLAYYGYIPNFPAKYGWKNFINDYFGAKSDEDLLIKRSFGGAIYSETLDDYTKSLYKYEDIRKAMEESFSKAYDVDVMNIVVSVDYNYDGTPDTKIVESNKETTKEENWTAEQITLAEELSKLLMERYNEALPTGTITEQLTEMVEIYKKAPLKPTAENSDLEAAFAKYKLAGLQVKFEKTTNYTNSSSLVQEFHDEMAKMYAYAKNNNLVYDKEALEKDANYENPIQLAFNYSVANDEHKYAFASSYGYHAVAVEKAGMVAELPTEDEANLYKAATKLAETQKSLATAKTNLESATGNDTSVKAYKAEIKQLEKEIEEQVKEVKDLLAKLNLTGMKEDNTYELDEKISEKGKAWYDNAVTEAEEHVVEKHIIDQIKAKSSEIKFADGFNKGQFDYYLDYLVEQYNEEH